jgi:predicted transglutaminase-like cysteine proteinase
MQPPLAALARRPRPLASLLLFVVLTLGAAAAPDFDKLARLAEQRYHSQGLQAVQQWRALMRDAQDLPEADKLARVNEFFNRRIAFREDSEIWNQSDYWATPLETIGRGAGDCEDFSIAKYVTLKLMGIPVERMRLIYVRAQIGGPHSTVSQAHMVLGYYPSANAEPLVLDNLVSEIRPAGRRPDLYPVFSFNSEGLWTGSSAAGSATTRLSRWRDVLNRMQQDGIE